MLEKASMVSLVVIPVNRYLNEVPPQIKSENIQHSSGSPYHLNTSADIDIAKINKIRKLLSAKSDSP